MKKKNKLLDNILSLKEKKKEKKLISVYKEVKEKIFSSFESIEVFESRVEELYLEYKKQKKG